MKSNYEPLGKHIQLVDYRNSEEVTSTVLGISIDKEFMPSVANVIGTDLSRYKLISKGLFACNPMHVGRDERLPIALYEKDSPAIVSPAYFMFEIIDRDVLNEEYLMMWFRRPEFDRECWFMTDGSVRGGITWDDLCRIKLPVTSYARQCEIVESYRAITDRIALKRAENDNLEAAAQAIYKKMFVDDVDSANLPDGWKIIALENVAELSAGGDRPAVYSDYPTDICNVPIFSNGIDKEGLYGFTDKAKVFEESVTVSARGTVGYVFLREKPYVPIVRLISVVPNPMLITAKYLLFALSAIDLHSTGTSQQQITVPDFKKRLILVPNEQSLDAFMQRITPLFNSIKDNKAEIESLLSLQANFLTLLSR